MQNQQHRNEAKIPLMLMVKNRTNLMQNLLKLIKPDAKIEYLEEAYFVGVLSLLDVLVCIKIDKILEELNVLDEVKEAILEGKGLFGEIFEVVKAVELMDEKKDRSFFEKIWRLL